MVLPDNMPDYVRRRSRLNGTPPPTTTRSFSQPRQESNVKKAEMKTSNTIKEIAPPPKAVLTACDGTVPRGDSLVTRPARSGAKVLGSHGEEEDGSFISFKGKNSNARSTESLPSPAPNLVPSPAPTLAQSPAPSSVPSRAASPVPCMASTPRASSPSLPAQARESEPSGIPKRITARKQFPRWRPADAHGAAAAGGWMDARGGEMARADMDARGAADAWRDEVARGGMDARGAAYAWRGEMARGGMAAHGEMAQGGMDAADAPGASGVQAGQNEDSGRRGKRKREQEEDSSSDSEGPVQPRMGPRMRPRMRPRERPLPPYLRKLGRIRAVFKRRYEEDDSTSEEDNRGCLKPEFYNPAVPLYHPVQHACWKAGNKMPYLALVRTLEMMELNSQTETRASQYTSLSPRLRKVEILSNLLRSVVTLSPPDLLPVLHLCLSILNSPRQGLEFGVGDVVVLQAVSEATGRDLETLQAETQEAGSSVPKVAEKSCRVKTPRVPPLTAAGVLAKFREISLVSYNTSKKIEIMKSMFVACRHCEARYIAQHLSGYLSLGLTEDLVLSALAYAVSLTPPGRDSPPTTLDAGRGRTPEARMAWLEGQASMLRQVFSDVPDLNRVVAALLEHGLENVQQHCKMEPGIALKPMMVSATWDIPSALRHFEKEAFPREYKYNGVRAQVHFLPTGEVKVFSHEQYDQTQRFPAILDYIPKIKRPSVASFIMDTEVVAWNPDTKEILPRKRILCQRAKDKKESDVKVQVCLYAFDLLYLNGMCLTREPLAQRRRLLRTNFVEMSGRFLFPASLDTREEEHISQFLEEAVKDSWEGLMVKALDSTYELASRSQRWLKLKKEYLSRICDSLDLVVIGAYLGDKRSAGRYVGFLLATYDVESKQLQAVCKVLIGIGFTENQLEQHYPSLQALVRPCPPSNVQVPQAVTPDCWFEPQIVWEVKSSELCLSSSYLAACGLVDPHKGVSLHFTHVLQVKGEQKPEEATASAQIAQLYWSQLQGLNLGGHTSQSEPEELC